MALITVSKKALEARLKRKLSRQDIERIIPSIGTALEGVEDDTITIEIFPNRPDMLSEEGFLRALMAHLGISPGLKAYPVKKSGSHITVGKTLKIWPYVVCAIVKGLTFDDERIRDAIQVQEKLGQTLCRNRKKGGIGVYPLDKIALPVTFTTRKAEDIIFRPLEFPKAINGRHILSQHPTGRAYARIIADETEFPVFIDGKGTVMSMPPIINSHELGKITERTGDVFIEATGPDLETLRISLNIIVTMFADMGGSIYSLDIRYKDKTITTPNLSPKSMTIGIPYVNRRLGLSLKETDIKRLLARMGHNYSKGRVEFPAYRVDIMHPVDLAEDIAIAYGYDGIASTIPHVATIGHENPMEILKEKVRDILIGLALIEVKGYSLSSKDIQKTRMRREMQLVELENALSEEQEVMRQWIIPGLLRVLADNKHNEYPQNIFEIGTVFSHAKDADTGVGEGDTLGIALCSLSSNYTKIKQVIECLCGAFALKAEIREEDHPSFIKGRCARMLVNQKTIAILGEIHPEVIGNFGLAYPTAAGEVYLKEFYDQIRK